MSPKVPTKAVAIVTSAGRKVAPAVAAFVGKKLLDALNDPERLETWFAAGAERLRPQPSEVLSVEEIEASLDALDVVLAEHGDALPARSPSGEWSERVRRLRVALTLARSAPAAERLRQTRRVQKQAETLYRRLSKTLMAPQRRRITAPRQRRLVLPGLARPVADDEMSHVRSARRDG